MGNCSMPGLESYLSPDFSISANARHTNLPNSKQRIAAIYTVR